MAERVNAFKSKYTGEQIDNLLDMLNSDSLLEQQAGEGQYYSTESNNATMVMNSNDGCSSQSYKHGIMTVSTNSTTNGSDYYVSNLLNILIPNSAPIYFSSGFTLMYTFDVPVTIKRMRYSGGKPCTLYFLINGSWVSQGSFSTGTITLTPQTITQAKVVVSWSGGGYKGMQYCIFDFTSDEYVTGMSIKDGTL